MANDTVQSSPAEKPNYKKQLDQAAEGQSASTVEMATSFKDAIIDKVSEYVPQAAGVLEQFSSKPRQLAEENGIENGTENGTASDKNSQVTADSKSETSQGSAGPERPHHDVQIEEFLREQHRSKHGKEVLRAAKGKV